MTKEIAIPLDQLALPKLLEAYTDARLAKRDDEMKRINDEISRRREAAGGKAEPAQDTPGQP
jgi:hypothetical protein